MGTSLSHRPLIWRPGAERVERLQGAGRGPGGGLEGKGSDHLCPYTRMNSAGEARSPILADAKTARRELSLRAVSSDETTLCVRRYLILLRA